MPTFIVVAEVACEGVYEVEADTEEEAIEVFTSYDWDDRVEFLHYRSEDPDNYILEIYRND